MHEHEFITFAAPLFQQRQATRVRQGIGDDAAIVLPVAGTQEVISSDVIVDGVHFQRSYTPPEAIGYKALTSALSDLAAMGAQAAEGYLTVGLPSKMTSADQRALLEGVARAANQYGVTIAGGDTSASATLFVAATVVGTIEAKSEAVRRCGAQAGDIVGVTGTLGASGAGLAVLRGKATGDKSLITRHLEPQPRLDSAVKLRRASVSAMIDLSDGLATDLCHIAKASNVTINVELESLPVDQPTAEVAAQLQQAAWELAACGGEDYELCFCVPETQKAAIEKIVDVTWIGSVHNGEASVNFTFQGDKKTLRGFEHRFMQ